MANADWYKHVVAVTGTIGSGKTSCVQYFKQCGAWCVSADDVAREVVAKGSNGLRAVVEKFGQEFLLADGSLDRKKLGAHVFNHAEARRELEAILHPLIHERVGELFRDALTKHFPLLVYDCPLLFEAGLNKKGFKAIVLVVAPPDECLRRIMSRDGLPEQEAKRRIASQWPVEKKVREADIVIENSVGLEELGEKTQQVFERLKR